MKHPNAPTKIWVVKFRQRNNIRHSVALSAEEALEMEAQVLLRECKDVEVYVYEVAK